eukprot:CAMPEP_0204272910 /NCGR_PEP_ID=MMETSP0468-20130131/22355_1 /ASSEMBLY_ACC=CAM_ASM_000383 /TAXON_ID=2969 /ORGANISM="Oxyrrhis marina" /LENGTH=90 /DNA_ID=CAMNT_0051248817 /DNA_START=93 /DNA_END=365 /DNA_ORIENTATION=-
MATENAVFVRGFDFGTTEDQIRSHCGSAGAITSVKFQGKGSAVVSYSSMAEASAACSSLPNTTIPGNSRYIEVKLDEGKRPTGKGKGKGK